MAIAAATFGQRPSAWLGVDDPGLADEFDRTCAVYFREWEDAREELRLKRFWNWAWGDGKRKGKTSAGCRHERFDPAPGGGVKCRDCGEVGY